MATYDKKMEDDAYYSIKTNMNEPKTHTHTGTQMMITKPFFF
jgi:hypothetical protein